MKMPVFGFISGLATISTFLPYSLALAFMFLTKKEVDAVFIILFAVITRATSEWVFWGTMFPKEMDTGENLETWRSSVKDILLSQSESIKSIFDMIIDTVVDIFLIYTALKISIPPALVFLVYVSCQAVAAPIQGIVITLLNRKNVRIFSMVVTALATMVALEANGMTGLDTYVRLFGLSQLTVQTKILIVLGVKNFLSGITVIAKANIAEVIKIKTVNKIKKA